jgi:hypothetical protein
MKPRCVIAAILSTVLIAAPAAAGEIKGPPPTGNGQNTSGSISNGRSLCDYSGLNDTPDGFGEPGTPEYDPGGQVQSYGYFMSHYGLYDPSDPNQRAGFAFPGFGCNPERVSGGA